MVHTSATSAGLQRSLELLAPEGTVIELSWYGDAEVHLSLGGTFHSSRLGIRASQVGTVSPRRARRGYSDRMALAMRLLADPRFDVLVSGECAFDDLPALMSGEPSGLCVRVLYGETQHGET